MCGICGVFEYATGSPVSRTILADMLEVIRHRGPDDGGMHVDGGLGIGSRRLAIIDLPRGRQPISNEAGDIVVVFNGEIYNYRELADGLRRRGHVFSTKSDTEVIVHLYEELGDDLVRQLRGMFAFAIWDSRRRRLFAARDRLGIKPFYYADWGGRLAFGSEIKAILQHPEVTTRLSATALSHFLSLKYVPAPETMFAGISALPPGHLLVCDDGGVRTRRHWDLPFASGSDAPAATEEESAECLAELLRDCVRSHLVSDVPFGAFLSGGLDSSAVVALMSEFLDAPVKTFSVGFEGEGEAYSELRYARLVAERYGTDHHEVVVRPADFVDLAEKIVWHLDQPIADNACLPNYLVSELASRHVKMVMTGEGGDELFAGYARHAGDRFAPLFQATPAPVRAMTLALASRLPRLRRPKLALHALCQPDEATRLVNWFVLFNDDMKANLLTEAFRGRLDGAGIGAAEVFAGQLARTDARDRLSRMLYVDTKLWLPDDLLARGDKMSMAASLEARVPLLDHELVEFAAALPPHLKVHRLTRKYLLKKVSAPLLPPEIISRKKQGFPVPLSVWFRDEAREFVRDHLSARCVERRGLFDATYVDRLLTDHERGFADHGSLIWALLSVEIWHRLFIDSRAGTRAGISRNVADAS